MPKILIPTPLRQFADKKDAVEVSGATVGEALAALTAAHPDMKKNLFNDEDIRFLEKDKTAVAAGDTISIVPSIAGGR